VTSEGSGGRSLWSEEGVGSREHGGNALSLEQSSTKFYLLSVEPETMC